MESNSSIQLPLDELPPSPLSFQVEGIIGIIGIILNIVILIVFFNTKHLKSSSLLIGLIIANATNSLAHVCYGFWGSMHGPGLVSPLYCIQIIWPALFVTIFWLLPVLLASAGLERLLALVAPVWFRTVSSRLRLWMVLLVMSIACVISMGITWMLAWLQSDHFISDACVPPQMIGVQGILYAAHLPSVFGGISATISSATGVYVGIRKIQAMPSSNNAEIGRMKRHIKLAQCLLLISCIDVICVVMPNILLVLSIVGSLHFPFAYSAYPLCLFCLDSVLNISAFVLFNSEFRKSFMHLLRCGKTVVHSITTSGQQGGQQR